MTKGMYESKICEVVSKFELEYMGRGPTKISAKILGDIVLIRLWGFLTPAEKLLTQTNEGTELIKKVREKLFIAASSDFKNEIKKILDYEIISIHSDVSTVTGEKIIAVTFRENIEVKLV